MPSSRWTMHAVLGNTKSGVEVATMIRPTSDGASPAASSATRAARLASTELVTSGEAR
jgi:hypothetical protein